MEVDQSNSVTQEKSQVSDQTNKIETKDGYVSYDAFKNIKEEKNSYREKAKALEAERNELLEKAEEEKRSKLEQANQYKELYEKRTGDYEAVKAELNDLTTDLIKYNKVSYLESRLPAKFKKQEYKDLVTKKYLDQIKIEDGQIDDESVQVAVNDIMKNYGADILDIKTNSNMPNNAAPLENEISLSSMTREERHKLILDRRKKGAN